MGQATRARIFTRIFMRIFTGTGVLALGFIAPAVAQDAWTFTELGVGIKPALAIDPDGAAHVSFLTEAIEGAAFYATNAGGDWTTETLAEGYFYGPVDIDVGADGTPFVTYHDHQAASFDQALGAGVIHYRKDGAWITVTVEDMGHDQWDADIAAASGGIWHLAGIDPSQFGSSSGLEYVTNAFGDVRVEEVGSGAIPYEFGVSIEIDPDANVGISFYNADPQDLFLAERGAGPDGAWTIQTIDTDGDVGRYSDLAYDNAGAPHISYWQFTGANTGEVRYATRDSSGDWTVTTVGTLSDVEAGFTGARKITAIEVGTDGQPRIMYGDKSQLVYATRAADGAWATTVVREAGDRPFGQLMEFDLAPDGTAHFTSFEVTQGNPLEGIVFYGTNAN